MAVMHPNDQELQRYLNRRCSAKEDRRIGYHIKACSGCRRRISVLLDMEMALEELPVLQAPSDLADRVMSSIEVEASLVSFRTGLGSNCCKREAARVLAFRTDQRAGRHRGNLFIY